MSKAYVLKVSQKRILRKVILVQCLVEMIGFEFYQFSRMSYQKD